jgi:hypothetical protein
MPKAPPTTQKSDNLGIHICCCHLVGFIVLGGNLGEKSDGNNRINISLALNFEHI